MAGEPCELYRSCDHLSTRIGIGLIVGGTGSGKTQLLMDVLTRRMMIQPMPYWHKIIFLCPTAQHQGQYFSGFPERDVYSEPNDFAEVLARVTKHQLETADPKPICIVMDDVIGCLRGKKDADFVDKFNRLVTSGRHIHVFVIVLTQYVKDRIFSSTLVRGNLSFVIGAAGGLSDVNLEKFIELLGEGKERGGKIVSTAASENYRFVARDYAADSKNPGKRVSMIKVDPSQIPKLTIRYRD